MNTLEIRLKILETIASIQQRPSHNVSDVQIAERLDLALQEVRDHLDLMEDAGLIKLSTTFGGPGCIANPTALGRMSLRDP
jgi:predicted ArsR family transcriptional regulator